MKDGTKDNYSSGSQKLDYIGVPLNVKYRAFGYRRLSVYASAGLLAYTPADNSRGRHEGAAARWTLSTSATTGMGASSVTNSTATYVEAVGPDDVIWADNPQLGIGIFNQGKSVKTEYKHRLPVRVGLNVAYRLTDRLSVESGVSYTRLSSDMKDGTKDNYSSGSQKLDYIGVPLNVKYRAFGLSLHAFPVPAKQVAAVVRYIAGLQHHDRQPD